jgi:hypothetical protein
MNMPKDTDNRCTVINPDGTFIAVKNLRWLLRHAYQVTAIHFITRTDSSKAVMTAQLSDNRAFQCVWNDIDIGLDWCNRPSLRHVQPTSSVATLDWHR